MKGSKGVAIASAVVFLVWQSSAAAAPEVEYERWPDGAVKERREYTAAGTVGTVFFYRPDGTVARCEKFDDAGRKVAEAHYDEEGKLCEGIDGWAIMRFSYVDGTLRQESYYGADGTLQERKTYSATGDLIDKEYVGDERIDPSEEFNPPVGLGEETEEFYGADGQFEGSTGIVSE